jgi:hypothetical protein
MTRFVLLILTVTNTWTGQELETYEREFHKTFSITPLDLIEECRTAGVALAHKATAYYRARGVESASSNVDCEWYRIPGDPA